MAEAALSPIVIRPQPGPQEAFLSSPADIVIYGGGAGGGKTFGEVIDPLRYIENGNFGAVFFRRTSPQITNEGGLWDEAGKIYPLLGGVPRESPKLDYRFPSGAKFTFSHMQLEKNRYDWQGAQIPGIYFDELTHFEQSQFWYMLSRNRSTCGVKPYIRATCNPDVDSWVAKLVEWYVDQETGYAINERSGKLRHFVRVSDELIWANDPNELGKRYPDLRAFIKSFTFIPASVYDNKKLLEIDPGYVGNLLALPLVEQERLLRGNWKIRKIAGIMFQMRHFEERIKLAALPRGEIVKWVRYWDLAASDRDTADYSVGVLMGIGPNIAGRRKVYVVDVIRGQWSKLERNARIKQAIYSDEQNFGNVKHYIEESIGLGIEAVRAIIDENLGRITADKPKGKKTERADPWSTACQAGNAVLVEGPWNDAYVDEHVSFPDPLGKIHDDQVDASSGGFKVLTTDDDISLEWM